MQIRVIELLDIPNWIRERAIGEGILINNKCKYYGAFIDEVMVGFCGILFYQDSALLKCLYVLLEYRNQGIGSALVVFQLKEIGGKGIDRAIAHCTLNSLSIYQRYGAEIVQKYKNGITKVKYENLSQSICL